MTSFDPATVIVSGANAEICFGRVSEFVDNQFRTKDVGPVSLGVVKTSAGYYAIRNMCPHQGAPLCRGQVGGTFVPSSRDTLKYGLQGRVVRCPWHAWEFSLETGRPVFSDGPGRVRTFPVRVAGGNIYVSVPARWVRDMT